MMFTPTFKDVIPVKLYVELSNKFPQHDSETDEAWVRRMKQDPSFAQKMFGTAEFKTELAQAVTRRQMALAGGRRVGEDQASLLRMVQVRDSARRKELGLTVRDSFADEYRKDHVAAGTNQYRDSKGMYDHMISQFEAATPANGSIFWNGINELSLAKMVDDWNTQMNGEFFGQLEATTAARYVNKQFVWEDGPYKDFFGKTSEMLGSLAKGHVTSVARCGLRFDSIFTTIELPEMFRKMEAELAGGKPDPTVTDMSFVIIEPKTETGVGVKVYINNAIATVPIVRPKPNMRINGPEYCDLDGFVQIPPHLAAYWAKPSKRKVTESPAATRIKSDFARLVKWP